jgi:hypothetical protein
MAKKSRSSGKEDSQVPGEEVTPVSVPELNIPTPTATGIIDFYKFFCGVGILMAIIMILGLAFKIF